MPSRILREGINSSARINALSDGAEILYRRLMSVADDYGRFYAAAQTILGACWPTAPDKVSVNQVRAWMQELEKGDNPLVIEYIVDGCNYLQITDFGQKIRTKSKFPDPCPQSVSRLSADCQQIVDSLPADCPQPVDKMPALVGGVFRISESEAKSEQAPAAPAPAPIPINRDHDSDFHRLYARHPQAVRRQRGLAKNVYEQSVAAGIDPDLIEQVHAQWCRSENWRWKQGVKAPTLAEWIVDHGWEFPPEEPPPEENTSRSAEADRALQEWANV